MFIYDTQEKQKRTRPNNDNYIYKLACKKAIGNTNAEKYTQRKTKKLN